MSDPARPSIAPELWGCGALPHIPQSDCALIGRLESAKRASFEIASRSRRHSQERPRTEDVRLITITGEEGFHGRYRRRENLVSSGSVGGTSVDGASCSLQRDPPPLSICPGAAWNGSRCSPRGTESRRTRFLCHCRQRRRVAGDWIWTA